MTVIECLESMGIIFIKGEIVAVPEGCPKPSNYLSLGDYYLRVRNWYIAKYY